MVVVVVVAAHVTRNMCFDSRGLLGLFLSVFLSLWARVGALQAERERESQASSSVDTGILRPRALRCGRICWLLISLLSILSRTLLRIIRSHCTGKKTTIMLRAAVRSQYSQHEDVGSDWPLSPASIRLHIQK